MSLSARQTARIQARQQLEIERLVQDRGYARIVSLQVRYSRIGAWLPADRGESVLELGCGPGRFVAILGQLGYRVTGADPFGADSFPTWRLIGAMPQVELMGGVFAESLPYPSAAFDHVACMGALLYFRDTHRALGEMRRVMKPGGRLVLRTVNRGNLYTRWTGRKLDPASQRLFSMDELVEEIAAAGFRINQSFAHGFWPPVLTNYWWYLQNTRIPIPVQDWMSSLTPPAHRINLTVFATRD